MKLINRAVNFFGRRQFIAYWVIAIAALALFTYLLADPTFADPDSFYHAKMAQFLAQKGAITEFPWLFFTTLHYNFIDHHFLYHLVLVPFVTIFPPLIGLKVATVIFASLTILFIFWFLRQQKVKGAFWYVLFLLTVNPFIFRLALPKSQPLVLLFLFLFLYFLLSRKYLGLIIISSLYVWLYAGWPLALGLASIYVAINWFWSKQQRGWLFLRRLKIGKIKAARQNFWLLSSVILGTAAGLFFSPYFPKNFYFYWQQSFKIAILNYQYAIGVGAEWYPYQIGDLLLGALPFFIFLAFAIFIFICFYKRQPMNTWFFAVSAFIFLALTLKSRRYVEYFIPLAFCFSVLSLNSAAAEIKNFLAIIFSKRLLPVLPALLLLILSPVFYLDLQKIKDFYQNSFSFTKFAEASSWLKQHSSPGDIVFHSDWDEFPILFYNNDKNYYIVGLDPTFMYDYDKDLYGRWRDITLGRYSGEIYPTIKNLFAARYVFVDFNQNAEFDRNLASNFYFKKVFSDSEARIYQVAE
ncbi:MAG: hypothetical protein WC768_04130 [Patescibacteria group bacterium]|jgi:hypothetical protein